MYVFKWRGDHWKDEEMVRLIRDVPRRQGDWYAHKRACSPLFKQEQEN